jgi:hypothetical protein
MAVVSQGSTLCAHVQRGRVRLRSSERDLMAHGANARWPQMKEVWT